MKSIVVHSQAIAHFTFLGGIGMLTLFAGRYPKIYRYYEFT